MEPTVTIDVEERRKDKVKNTRIHDKPTHSMGGGRGLQYFLKTVPLLSSAQNQQEVLINRCFTS